MRLLLTALVGCIYVTHTEPWGESGDSGLDRTDELVCTSDDQCPGTYACSGAVSTSTDGFGCVERCDRDTDCKAGSVCLPDGACGE